MKLKALELNGFKSFGKKSRLVFTSPLSAVVGPNGSGKSNVVEAFRFVLGEQSMKSLRGKSGKDLIFSGSHGASKLARASVSITFDNKDKKFQLPQGDSAINLDFDEIVITREVFADGNNAYSINNSPVRLKDIIELLASVHIGSTGHHIISQGQADRILSANSKERRGMIEDALGLKIYQYRLKESEKKLEKTRANIRETELVRRELGPHLRYLKKQVEKIQKGEELRTELAALYQTYFVREQVYLSEEELFVKTEKEKLESELSRVVRELEALQSDTNQTRESEHTQKISDIERGIGEIRSSKEQLSRALGKLEGLIELEEKKQGTGDARVTLPVHEVNEFIDAVHEGIDAATKTGDLAVVISRLRDVKDSLASFRQKFKLGETPSDADLKKLRTDRDELARQMDALSQTIQEREREIAALHVLISQEKEARYKEQEERFSREHEKSKLSSSLEILKTREVAYLRRKELFGESMKEAVVLVGQALSSALRNDQNLPAFTSAEEEDARRQIERIKIKLEDIGTAGGADVLKEFEDVSSRESFLAKELDDLEASVKNLEHLIEELKTTLDAEFKNGLQKINERFEEFFKLMFGGGNAFLSLITEKSKKKGDDEEGDLLVVDEQTIEQGIDIHVSLPQKKVKELTMLSGGERSLTSIALLFAMSQVNPPPFLVLDETDAALDEANSKRYGDMLERLSKYSELIVVTHNRETMSRADLIYGVTIGSDGVSKLLSIKFAEAEGYAK